MGSLLTIEEVQQRLGISRMTVWRRCKDGHLSGRRVGKRIMIPETEVEQLKQGIPVRSVQLEWICLSPERISEISERISLILQTGGAPGVNKERLQLMIQGDCHPDFLFWVFLANGLERMEPCQELSHG